MSNKTHDSYWTYYLDGEEDFDARFKTQEEAYRSADDDFQHQCVDDDEMCIKGYSYQQPITLVFIEEDENQETINRKEISRELYWEYE